MLSVLFPYRCDDGPRDRLFGWVLAWWQVNFPEAEICVGRNFEHPFNRGAARNAAFDQSTGSVLIVADADTVPTAQGVKDAIAEVVSTKCWSFPYAEDRYYNLTQAHTETVLHVPPSDTAAIKFPHEPAEGQYDHKITSWAGCLIMPREAWEAVDGYDERFRGWGYEDDSFRMSLDMLWGSHRRQDSYVCHLFHERGDADFNQPHIQHNRDLYNRYRRARTPEDVRGVRDG